MQTGPLLIFNLIHCIPEKGVSSFIYIPYGYKKSIKTPAEHRHNSYLLRNMRHIFVKKFFQNLKEHDKIRTMLSLRYVRTTEYMQFYMLYLSIN